MFALAIEPFTDALPLKPDDVHSWDSVPASGAESENVVTTVVLPLIFVPEKVTPPLAATVPGVVIGKTSEPSVKLPPTVAPAVFPLCVNVIVNAPDPVEPNWPQMSARAMPPVCVQPVKL